MNHYMPECLGCNYIATAPVTLRDGRVVCTSCEAWRLECEARFILKRKDPERREYLRKVGISRGEPARADLRNEMIALLKAKSII